MRKKKTRPDWIKPRRAPKPKPSWWLKPAQEMGFKSRLEGSESEWVAHFVVPGGSYGASFYPYQMADVTDKTPHGFFGYIIASAFVSAKQGLGSVNTDLARARGTLEAIKKLVED